MTAMNHFQILWAWGQRGGRAAAFLPVLEEERPRDWACISAGCSQLWRLLALVKNLCCLHCGPMRFLRFAPVAADILGVPCDVALGKATGVRVEDMRDMNKY